MYIQLWETMANESGNYVVHKNYVHVKRIHMFHHQPVADFIVFTNHQILISMVRENDEELLNENWPMKHKKW